MKTVLSLAVLWLVALVPVAPNEPPFGGTIFIAPGLITSADPTTFVGLSDAGRGPRTIFDRRVGRMVSIDAWVFHAEYADLPWVEVIVNPEFDSAAAAEAQARRLAEVIGRLPKAVREAVETVWINAGDQPFGGGNHNLLIHVGQADIYQSAGILEEALIHEAAHTSLDAALATAPEWLAAQVADSTFISVYARENSIREDVAETFLTYLAVRHRRDRISAGLRDSILAATPNRNALFDALSLDMSPIN